jgi:hypothetical protein
MKFINKSVSVRRATGVSHRAARVFHSERNINQLRRTDRLAQVHLRIDLSWGTSVEEFRYYCLHDNGRIAFGESVLVDCLEDAIRQARTRCEDNIMGMTFGFVEVWRGGKRVFTDYGPAGGA